MRLCSSCIYWFLKLLLALIVSVVTALCLCEVVLLMDLSLASCSSTYVYLGISTCLSLLGRFVQHLLSAQHFSQYTSCNLIYQTVAPSRSKGGNPSSLCIWPPAPVRPNTLLWQMICWSVCTAYFITWIQKRMKALFHWFKSQYHICQNNVPQCTNVHACNCLTACQGELFMYNHRYRQHCRTEVQGRTTCAQDTGWRLFSSS